MEIKLYDCFKNWIKTDNNGNRQGSIFIFSDPHFGDEDMLENFNYPNPDELVKTLSSQYGKNDTIICLGDVGNIEYVSKMRKCYKKILIKGNHDAGYSNYERKIIYKKFDSKKYTEKEAMNAMKEEYPGWAISFFGEGYDFHEPFTYWYVRADNQLFDEVYEGALIISEKIILSHERVDIPWLFNIHGHDHSSWVKDDENHLNMALNVNNYKMLRFTDFLKAGKVAKVNTIHRVCIDRATERAEKRGYSLKKKYK